MPAEPSAISDQDSAALLTSLEEAALIAERQISAMDLSPRPVSDATGWFGQGTPPSLPLAQAQALRERVAALEPWLQGPFRLAEDVVIDGRWRNDDRWKALDAHVGDLRGRRVLDVGSNAGYDPFTFHRRGAAHVTACEPYHFVEQLRLLEEVYTTGIDIEPLAWQELSPERHGRFDLVHCNGVLYHEPNLVGLVARLRELVADDGRLLLGTMVLERGDLAEYARFVPHEHAGDPTWWWIPGRAAMRWMLEEAGFEVEVLRDTFFRGPQGSVPVLNGYFSCTPRRADRLPVPPGGSPRRAEPMAAARRWPRLDAAAPVGPTWPAPGPFEPRAASERLIAFVDAMPHERGPIAGFVQAVARSLPTGTRVLDLGAGDAPFRELFAHTEYVTSDHPDSPHEGGRAADVLSAAEELPLADESFDVVLATQVLEHVVDPARVVEHVRRVLRPGGAFFATVPLLWEVHEAPHDFRRFTDVGLEQLLHQAGLTHIEVRARNDAFSSIAQLLLNARAMLVPEGTGVASTDLARTAALLEGLSHQVARLAPLDALGTMPLGYTAAARRPG